jgi:hypothetical protein
MIPNEMVKVQVTVWRQSDLPQAMQDDQECPPGVTFDLQNTPSADPSPVLGGQSYFKVGSSATADVTLQCMYAELLGECSGFTTHVTATVQDFSNFLFPVVPAKAGELVVAAVGPTIAPGNGQWVIDPTDVVSLTLGQISPLPLWDGDLAHAFERALCVQVFDPTDFAAATSVQCVRLDDDAEIKEGMLVPTSSLDAVSTAIGEIPETGVVLGVVLDANGQPADGVTITPTFGTVQYLSPDLTSTLDGLGVPLRETTASGAFVSTDVPFGTATELTQWTADKLIAGEHVNEQRAALGGLVRGKLTFVKLVLKPSP